MSTNDLYLEYFFEHCNVEFVSTFFVCLTMLLVLALIGLMSSLFFSSIFKIIEYFRTKNKQKSEVITHEKE